MTPAELLQSRTACSLTLTVPTEAALSTITLDLVLAIRVVTLPPTVTEPPTTVKLVTVLDPSSTLASLEAPKAVDWEYTSTTAIAD